MGNDKTKDKRSVTIICKTKEKRKSRPGRRIRKDHKHPRKNTGWRPLSLLNCDYKIAAKSIANRIQATLPKLINNDHTGFIKGRFIGENIRLIDSIINYTANENIPGLILLLDFEKAFDTLEWPFIEKPYNTMALASRSKNGYEPFIVILKAA